MTVIVRCEDLQQRVFLYRLLVAKGVPGRAIQIKHCPAGDAKQYVLKQFPVQVNAFRRTPHLSKAVVSMIDADDRTVAERKREHDDALESSTPSLAPRQQAERIAILVPRRNIETWLHSLLGNHVDENAVYPRFRGEERRCAPAVQEFAQRCPGRMRLDDPPSLRDGCEELQRILG